MNAKPLALIIEDNEDQNLVFTNALMQAGYNTELIQDGATAMKRLSRGGSGDRHIGFTHSRNEWRFASEGDLQGPTRQKCACDHRLCRCRVRRQPASAGGSCFTKARQLYPTEFAGESFSHYIENILRHPYLSPQSSHLIFAL